MSTSSIAAPAPPAARSSRLLLALAAVYVIWGSTYLAMRVVVETMPPLGMGAARFTVAGAILLAVARATGTTIEALLASTLRVVPREDGVA